MGRGNDGAIEESPERSRRGVGRYAKEREALLGSEEQIQEAELGRRKVLKDVAPLEENVHMNMDGYSGERNFSYNKRLRNSNMEYREVVQRERAPEDPRIVPRSPYFFEHDDRTAGVQRKRFGQRNSGMHINNSRYQGRPQPPNSLYANQVHANLDNDDDDDRWMPTDDSVILEKDKKQEVEESSRQNNDNNSNNYYPKDMLYRQRHRSDNNEERTRESGFRFQDRINNSRSDNPRQQFPKNPRRFSEVRVPNKTFSTETPHSKEKPSPSGLSKDNDGGRDDDYERFNSASLDEDRRDGGRGHVVDRDRHLRRDQRKFSGDDLYSSRSPPSQVSKWGHDMFEDANKSPSPPKDETLEKIEALLAS